MGNFWRVAKHEFRQTVMRRGFIIGTFAIPLGIVALIGVAILVETAGESKLPVGYVDQAGFLDESLQQSLPDAEDRITIHSYPDEKSALKALENEEIQVFFVFPPDYRETLKTDLHFLEKTPSGEVWREFDHFVRLNLLRNEPAELEERLLSGPDITVYDVTSGREFSENAVINIVLPIMASMLFFFATMSAAGYLLGVVAGEKENRMMEIMLTSVSPGQMIGGKAIGLLAAALSQLAVHIVTVVIGLSIAAVYVEFLQEVTIPWDYLGVIALFFLPAYALVAAVMVAIGSAVTEMQQAQQVAGIVNLFFMFPFFAMGIVVTNPGHPLMTFMTLFPTTAFLTISMRWGLGTIPVWQLVASWLLLVATTIIMTWAAARVFRMGMLRYGQPLNLKMALAAIQGK